MLFTLWSPFGLLGISKHAERAMLANSTANDKRMLDMWVLINNIIYKCNYILKHE